MADYPLPVFQFSVVLRGNTLGFSEVSGLTVEAQMLEYRDGMMKEFSTIKMPGMRKYSDITLKKGILVDDNGFYDLWKETADLGNVSRGDVVISLLNEKQEAVMVWNAKNAWALKVEGPGLKASGNEVAVETLVLAHEGLTIANG